MNRKLMAISVAAVVGIVAIWYVVLWSPQGASLKSAQASAAAALAKQVDLKGQVASLQKQRAQLPALLAQTAQIRSAIPSVPSVDTVIDNVNQVVLASGVSLSSLGPPQAAAAAASSANAMAFTATVSGTYFQLIDFVNRLNAMPRLAVVNGFSLGAPDKVSGKITTTVTATVFVEAAAAPAKAGATTTTLPGH